MLRVALLCVCLSGSVASAEVTPSGLIDAGSVNIGRSRIITVDNGVALSRNRGDEIIGRGGSGGSSTTGNGDPWLIGDSYNQGFFLTSDSFVHHRSGEISLNELGDASRVQGIVSQSVLSSFRVLEPVMYTITVTVSPELLNISGGADATLDFGYSIRALAADEPQVFGGDSLDLVAGADVYAFTTSGVFIPGDFPGIFSVNISSALSTVIDSPGERVDASFGMDVRVDFSPVPAPGTLAVFGSCAFVLGRRRRKMSAAM